MAQPPNNHGLAEGGPPRNNGRGGIDGIDGNLPRLVADSQAISESSSDRASSSSNNSDTDERETDQKVNNQGQAESKTDIAPENVSRDKNSQATKKRKTSSVQGVEAQRAYSREHTAKSRRHRKEMMTLLGKNIAQAKRDQVKLARKNDELKECVEAILQEYMHTSQLSSLQTMQDLGVSADLNQVLAQASVQLAKSGSLTLLGSTILGSMFPHPGQREHAKVTREPTLSTAPRSTVGVAPFSVSDPDRDMGTAAVLAMLPENTSIPERLQILGLMELLRQTQSATHR